MYLKHFSVVVLVAIGFAGCSNDSSSPSETFTPPPPNLTVIPSDGQGNIPLDATVALTFARPVDRAAVEGGVHLISERMMADSQCPDSSMMSHGGMSTTMMDSSLMRHMGQVHSTKGRFTWNRDSTHCYFEPDSMMTPLTMYMVHMGPEMMQMMRTRMGDMGMIGGHGFGMTQNDMMTHFITMDASGASGGHGHQ